MVESRQVVLVTGATGNQGGAVARRLAQGWAVRGLSRRPRSAEADALRAAGCEVVEGDFDDRGSLDRAMRGVQAVFSVQNTFAAGADAEARHGIAVAEAAAAAGVGHLVYSSAGGVDRVRGIDHFDSKRRIEDRIAALGLPATVLRPGWFVDNLLAPEPLGFVLRSALLGALLGGRTVQVIAVRDIAEVVHAVLRDPAGWIGEQREIATDEIDARALRAGWRAVRGGRFPAVPTPPAAVDLVDASVARMYRWLRQDGFHADIEGLHAEVPGLHRWPESLGIAGAQGFPAGWWRQVQPRSRLLGRALRLATRAGGITR